MKSSLIALVFVFLIPVFCSAQSKSVPIKPAKPDLLKSWLPANIQIHGYLGERIDLLLFMVITLIFSSCATLLNTRTENLSIITRVPCKIVINDDTLKSISTHNYVTVERSKYPLSISAFNDNNAKNISIKSRNSFAYWLNLYPSIYWAGFIVDKNNQKRYGYPRTIYIDTNSDQTNYLTYEPMDSTMSKYNNIIKFTPLKLTGLVNPALEISYERKTGDNFSTQIMGSYLLPESVMDPANGFIPNIKGYRLAVEEKFYLNKSAPIGPYISLELNYMKNRYKDIWNFGVKDIFSDTAYNYTNYPDTFGIKKQTYSINLKFGYQLFVKRFSFDFYAGLGLRYKDVSHFDRKNPDDEMEMPRHPNIYYISNLNGKYWTISIPLNFRIGWTF